ncbi:MAG TPA: hypothetical protein VLW50_07830 [Streptosporangiaceae bacterium]|nr:hypothetical protein [Streptosporangiaceae bacterium]
MSTRLYCEMCGESADVPVHGSCQQRAELEPPRYCPQCARRMVVQVNPMGWRASCSRHGDLHT